jgi:hypothetical protein
MISKIENFDVSKIFVYDPYDVNDNLVKIDISVDKMQPIMLRLEDLHVLSFSNTNIILDLRNKDTIKKIFDDIDSHIVSVIQERKITKRLKTKFNYRQFSSTYTNKDINYDILSLGLSFNNDNFSTNIYENKRTQLNQEEAALILKHNARAEVILELTSIVFDKQEGFIYLENVVRQMKVKKIKPKRVEHLAYSFVDSDNEDAEDNSDNSSDSDDDNNNKYLSDKSEELHLKTDDNCLLSNHDHDDELDDNYDDVHDLDTSELSNDD